MALIAVGGILGLLGSFLIGKKGKTLLGIAGILSILSAVVFVLGASLDLSKIGWSLFYSGTIYDGANVFAYLSFGFFLAIVAAILMFISLSKHPMKAEAVPLAPVAPPPPQP